MCELRVGTWMFYVKVKLREGNSKHKITNKNNQPCESYVIRYDVTRHVKF